jgi:hypothetical protein
MCKWLGIKAIDSFRVLGDDVVLADESLYNLYIQWTSYYQMPLSHHKCLIGNGAEFAGKFIVLGHDVTPIRWRQIGKSSLSELYYPYKRILGENINKLITDKVAFLTLGGLSRNAHGLGITGFDKTNPVTRYHLQYRVGLVSSLIQNFGKPSPSGAVLNLPQEELKVGLDSPPISYLRTLAAKLSAPRHVDPVYGLLPYLGNPSSVARQLGIEIPLMPLRKVQDKPWFLRALTSFNWRIDHGTKRERQGHSSSDFRNEIQSLTEELRAIRHESDKIAIEKASEEKIKREESFLRYYVPTLFKE